jgi:hypothetical protein
MGKLLIIIGVILILLGVFVTYQNRIPFLGKLPGDIRIEKENFKFYFPITTSILLSLLVSLVIFLINRWKQ